MRTTICGNVTRPTGNQYQTPTRRTLARRGSLSLYGNAVKASAGRELRRDAFATMRHNAVTTQVLR
jgi:hypothetical protein